MVSKVRLYFAAWFYFFIGGFILTETFHVLCCTPFVPKISISQIVLANSFSHFHSLSKPQHAISCHGLSCFFSVAKGCCSYNVIFFSVPFTMQWAATLSEQDVNTLAFSKYEVIFFMFRNSIFNHQYYSNRFLTH